MSNRSGSASHATAAHHNAQEVGEHGRQQQPHSLLLRRRALQLHLRADAGRAGWALGHHWAHRLQPGGRALGIATAQHRVG
eukprot:9024394-Pyramimonas_sp.AAC.1